MMYRALREILTMHALLEIRVLSLQDKLLGVLLLLAALVLGLWVQVVIPTH